ncbi:hypothetical protein, partial [Parafrankia sp. BMG5.11]|uniref:hypothetical protein n=1 Tax=Parafrankia sp. BMG5.11 TaxID=222540 RepID=UPI001A9CFCC2
HLKHGHWPVGLLREDRRIGAPRAAGLLVCRGDPDPAGAAGRVAGVVRGKSAGKAVAGTSET